MARKKKNNNNQTTSAAPNKEQAQKQSQEESRVIDELFGNLDERILKATSRSLAAQKAIRPFRESSRAADFISFLRL